MAGVTVVCFASSESKCVTNVRFQSVVQNELLRNPMKLKFGNARFCTCFNHFILSIIEVPCGIIRQRRILFDKIQGP